MITIPGTGDHDHRNTHFPSSAPCSTFRARGFIIGEAHWVLRKVLQQMSSVEAMELLRDKLLETQTNEEFLNSMA